MTDMNILFLTLVSFDSLGERGIYTDLLREFVKKGHRVYCISPIEKRYGKKTYIIEEDHAKIVRLQIGNTQKTNIIEKGISTVFIEPQFKAAIGKYFGDIRFDLVLYSTPPITLTGAVEYVKKRDGAATYLLLKDIFPQNAVDIGMMSKTGAKGLLRAHFRRQEKRLYAISDRIGCMSKANVKYVLMHNSDVRLRNKESIRRNGRRIIEVCPNSIEPVDMSISAEERRSLRDKYGIPQDKKVFVYGGNLGRPQGIPFMLKCIDAMKDVDDAFFLVVGSGTEYHLIEDYVRDRKPRNMVLFSALPKEDYDNMVGACDVGLIFLDHRFTIPNFPSRLLSYMQAKIPVLACTDPNTDVGKVIEAGGFGHWCESDSPEKFRETALQLLKEPLPDMGEKGYEYLCENYTAEGAYEVIAGGNC